MSAGAFVVYCNVYPCPAYVDVIVTFTGPFVHPSVPTVLSDAYAKSIAPESPSLFPPGTVPVLPPVIDVAFALSFPALSIAVAFIV